MSKAHSPLGPSASDRWVNCPGSVRFIEQSIAADLIRPKQSSIFADEGTVAHELAEKALTAGSSCFAFEGQIAEYDSASIFTREMCGYVQQYVDFVRLFKGDLLVEQEVKFTDWVPDGFGTSDAIVIQEDGIVCIDLKYGKGVPVDAEGNNQALCYALGCYQGLADNIKPMIKTVTMVIHQPRLDSVSEWKITIEELLRHGERIAQAAELATSEYAPIVPGEKQCRFCSAKPVCKEQQKLMESVVGKDFDDLTKQTPVNALTESELRRALEAKEQIVSWLSAVESHVTEILASGGTFEGFKLVEGRSLRQWLDEQQAEDVLAVALGESAYEPKKLISPAKAEKALGKVNAKTIQDLIVKAQGKPTLAPQNDKRPALNVSVEDF